MTSPVRQRARVLLALDNPDEIRAARALFMDAGYAVDSVTDGAGALEAVRRATYALVLLATELPGPGALVVSRRIRELPGDPGRVPIVAVKAGEDPDRLMACLDAGMDLCLTTPTDRQQLGALLGDWRQDPQTAESATLDTTVLERLESDTSPKVMPLLLATFRRETARRVAAVSRLRSAQNLHALRREAHSLKSSAGTFGAASLQQLARELESSCRDGENGPAGDLAAAIVAHWPRVVRALAQYPHDRECERSGNAQG